MIEKNMCLQTDHQPGNKKYRQLKISVETDIAVNFKKACAVSNTSMASILSKYMAEYSNTHVDRKPLPDYTTRRQRREAINKIVKQLEQIKDCEQDYCGRIPDNLQNSIVYERAEEFISYLETAIDELVSIGSI